MNRHNLQPHEILGVESALLDNVTTLLDVAGYIVSKAREAFHFRRDCLELANLTVALAATYNEIADTNGSGGGFENIILAKQFECCLREVHLFVVQCLQANIVHVAWEMMVQQKLTKLRATLSELQRALDTELLIRLNGAQSQTTKSLLALHNNLADMKDTATNTANERSQFLRHISDLENELQSAREEARSLKQTPPHRENLQSMRTYDISDSDISVSEWRNHGSMSKIPSFGTYRGLPVKFELICRNDFENIPRIVRVYKRIADVALVQAFYGILKFEDQHLAIMGSMEAHKPLSQAIADHTFEEAGPVFTLRYAYELAATISALHAAGLVIKSLSDMSVFVEKSGDGTLRPRLTQLDQARAIWEVSTVTEQDIRFDAPETMAAKTRSHMSDVWSLGVLILEIFIQKPPFVHFNEDSDDLNLRQAIRSTMELQNFDHTAMFPDHRHVGTVFASSQEIAYSCILRNPFLRPTASLVAQRIFDEFISMAAMPASTNMSTQNLADGKIVSPNSAFNNLAHRIISASRPKSAEESTILQSVANTSIATSISVTIPDTEFSSLLDAANLGAPALSYLVGIAYLKGLSALGMEQYDTSQPSEVLSARLAIPYLDQSLQQGYQLAAKELLRAHKILAKFYYELASRPQNS